VSCRRPSRVPFRRRESQASSSLARDNAKSKGLLSSSARVYLRRLACPSDAVRFPMCRSGQRSSSNPGENANPQERGLPSGAYCFGIVSASPRGRLQSSPSYSGRAAAKRFATNPYVNMALAVLFVLWPLNLFGMLQVAYPRELTNAFSPPESGPSCSAFEGWDVYFNSLHL